MKRFAICLILIFAFCGLADSAYIAQNESAGTPLICNVTSLTGCNVVAESPYNQLFGVSIAEYGMFFYALLFVLAAIELALPYVHVRRAIQGLTALGLIASAYFVFIQMSVINALCIYCLASAVISLIVFVVAYFIEPMGTREEAERHATIMPPSSMHSRLVLPPSQE